MNKNKKTTYNEQNQFTPGYLVGRNLNGKLKISVIPKEEVTKEVTKKLLAQKEKEGTKI